MGIPVALSGTLKSFGKYFSFMIPYTHIPLWHRDERWNHRPLARTVVESGPTYVKRSIG